MVSMSLSYFVANCLSSNYGSLTTNLLRPFYFHSHDDPRRPSVYHDDDDCFVSVVAHSKMSIDQPSVRFPLGHFQANYWLFHNKST